MVNGAGASRGGEGQGQENSGEVGQGVKGRESERGDKTGATVSCNFPAGMKDMSETVEAGHATARRLSAALMQLEQRPWPIVVPTSPLSSCPCPPPPLLAPAPFTTISSLLTFSLLPLSPSTKPTTPHMLT